MMNKFLDPKNDYAFKRIFGTEKNKKKVLIYFVSDIEMNTYEAEEKCLSHDAKDKL